jgi:DNA-binding transcriptional LysR family regulator
MQWDERIGRRLKLRDVHILLAVAQWGSMAKAAEQLAISHPVVSKTIADLEHTLGVRVLERSRRGAEPTACGRVLLKHGLAAFDELRQCVKEIEFLNDPTVGEVRIAGTEPMVAGLLPIVIERLCRRYPRLTVHVTQVYTTPDLYEGLRERAVDLVIGRLLGRIAEKDLQAETLFHDPPLVVAGAKNRWANRRKAELAELIDERWILPRPDTAVGALIAQTFHAAGLQVPQPAVTANSIHMNNALLASGHFLTMHPRSLVKLGAGRPSIKVVPVKLNSQRAPVGIVTLKNRAVSPVARLVIDCIREVARPLAKTA